MGKVKIKERQTVLDIAVQTSGSVEGAMKLAVANGLSITVELDDGTELTTVEAVDGETARRYELERIYPATEASDEDMESMPYGGIELMGIEIDFIVS